MLVVTVCCILAVIVPWRLRGIALDPFSPAGIARDSILRDPIMESDVKTSIPHTPDVHDVESNHLGLENADAAILEKLKQNAEVRYLDAGLQEVFDDLSTRYDIAFDTRSIAGTEARVVLVMKGFSLQSTLQEILRATNVYCDVEGTMMIIRASKNTRALESAGVNSQDSASTGKTMGSDAEVLAPAEPFAPRK
jgi:hypothetical protein